MEHRWEAPTFPTFQNCVTSPVLEKPQVHNETHCQVSLVLFWVHLHSFSQSFTGWLRGTLWGWILGTLTDLSGWHEVGLLSSVTFTGFLVNLSSCLGVGHAFCTQGHLWCMLQQVPVCGNVEGILLSPPIQEGCSYSRTFYSSLLFPLSIKHVRKVRLEVLSWPKLAWIFAGVYFWIKWVLIYGKTAKVKGTSCSPK